MRRGQVWWAELPDPIRSEPGYRRPVLIVQADEFNISKINTVIVAVITSNLDLAHAPGNVYIANAKTGLSKDSVVNVSQLLTLDKSFFMEHIGSLDNVSMKLVDEGLELVLSV